MATKTAPESVAIQIVVRGDDLGQLDAARLRLGLTRAGTLRAALRTFLLSVSSEVAKRDGSNAA